MNHISIACKISSNQGASLTKQEQSNISNAIRLKSAYTPSEISNAIESLGFDINGKYPVYNIHRFHLDRGVKYYEPAPVKDFIIKQYEGYSSLIPKMPRKYSVPDRWILKSDKAPGQSPEQLSLF